MEDIFTGNFLRKKRELKKFLDELVKAIPFLGDQEGEFINLHSARVSLLASSFAADVIESNRALVFLAGLYHDIGAVGSSVHPARVLSMADYFVDPRLSIHSIRGAQALKKISVFKSLPSVVLEHHEWFDGGGFPFKKKGAEILPEAQAIRIVDSFDSAMLITGRIDQALNIIERTAGREYDRDLFLIFKHYVKAGDFEYLWFDSERVLEQAISTLDSVAILFEEEDVFDLIDVFDLKKQPAFGHTRRVRDLVALACAELGYFATESMIKASFVHEVYTLYEPYRGTHIGSMPKSQVVEYFEQVYQAYYDLEEDPFINEIVNAACYLDRKLHSSFSELKKDDIASTLLDLNGRLDAEVIHAFRKVLNNHGHAIFKERMADNRNRK